jgi:predicted ABC-type ATPase
MKTYTDVPEEDIMRRFYRSMVNFWRIYKNISDTWILYSNSGNLFYEVAIGEKEQVNICDSSLFELFLENVKVSDLPPPCRPPGGS